MTFFKTMLIALAIGALAPVGAALAQDGGSILDRAINNPSIDSWGIYGENQRTRVVPAPEIPGGYAFDVRVSRGSSNPWDIGVNAPIAGSINEGDVLLLAVWARAVEPPEGQDFIRIPMMAVQRSTDPYTPLIQSSIDVTGEWKMYYASGAAAQAYGSGETTVAMHLATGRQIIDLGPMFVLNFGPGYNLASLPRNQ